MKQVLRYIWDHDNPQFKSEEQKCAFVIAKYVFAFIVAAVMAWISWDLANFINAEIPFSPSGISFFQTASVITAAVGVFGNPDKQIHTWGGKSTAEQLDKKISVMLSIIGCFLSFCSFQLIPSP